MLTFLLFFLLGYFGHLSYHNFILHIKHSFGLFVDGLGSAGISTTSLSMNLILNLM